MAALAACRTCNGTGWVQSDTPKGPVARRCQCFLDEERQSRYAALGIPPRFSDVTLRSMSTGRAGAGRGKDSMFTAAVERAKWFAGSFPICNKKGLLFHGGTPRERIQLAVATLKSMFDKGFSAAFWDYNHLMLELRKRNSSNPALSASGIEVARRVANVDVLLIDSLGSHPGTDWALATIGGIVKHRYYTERCLIATTGMPLTPPTLEEAQDPSRGIPERIAAISPRLRYTDVLADRIGEECLSQLLEHCSSVSIAAPVAPSGAPPRPELRREASPRRRSRR